MNRGLRCWLSGFVVCICAPAAAGEVSVRFDEPQRFLDASLQGYREPAESNRVLAQLRRHLLALGARCIADGQSLEITVRELDLAGDYERRRGGMAGNVRVLPGVVRSRMTVDYIWRAADGHVLAASVDRLDETTILGSEIRMSTWNVALPDEKAMITSWFESRFCPGVAVSHQQRNRP